MAESGDKGLSVQEKEEGLRNLPELLKALGFQLNCNNEAGVQCRRKLHNCLGTVVTLVKG